MNTCQVCGRSSRNGTVGPAPTATVDVLDTELGVSIASVFEGKKSCIDCDDELYILRDALSRADIWRGKMNNPQPAPKTRQTKKRV